METRREKMNTPEMEDREKDRRAKKQETRRSRGTRLRKMNAGVGDRETSRRAKESKRDENRGQG
ncbi:MAG: hypothetical protein ACLR23_25270 [Clostridia bacterium]